MPRRCILYLPKHHATKAYGGVEMYLHEFLTSVLQGGKGAGRIVPLL